MNEEDKDFWFDIFNERYPDEVAKIMETYEPIDNGKHYTVQDMDNAYDKGFNDGNQRDRG